MKTPTHKTSLVRTEDRYEFTRDEVIGALRLAGLLPTLAPFDPTTEEVDAFVRVPGGGDWSNTNLDLTDHPLVVTVKLESRS